ncbi:MAG: SpoIIE family protein phosphatase [Spirochaetes bacterium]|jgi:serine phosphatase RsbU (regulator of sigma subunit)|nr:SpoIIE family protein phosphatase [Spirochaetota bacterium]
MLSEKERHRILSRFRYVPYVTFLLPNILVGSVFFIYYWYLDIHMTLDKIRDYPPILFISSVMIISSQYFITFAFFYVKMKRISSNIHEHLSGKLDEKETWKLKKNLLNLNFFIVSATFLGWTITGLLILPCAIFMGVPAMHITRIFLINTFLGGTVAATVALFLHDTYIKKSIPEIFPDGDFSDLKGLMNIRINHKISAALWLSGVVPLISMYFISHNYLEIIDGGMDGQHVRWQYETLTAVIAASGIFAAAVTVFYFVRNTGQPLLRLKSVMKEIGKGNLEVRLSVAHTDEVGVLYQGINGMISGLRKAMDDREELILLDQELSIAKQVQQSVLTGADKISDDGHLECEILYLPKNGRVGGDYYNITRMEDGTVSFMLADATGHGIQAALSTMQIDNLNRQSLELRDPDRRLSFINSEYINKIHGKNIFSAFILNARSDSVCYSNAAHPAQFILKKTGAVEELKARGRLIGLMQDTGFECLSGTLEEGDIIVLFTDGAYEEFNGKGEIFGIERFRTLLIEASVEFRNGTLRDINARVKSAIEEFLSGEPWFDDMTVILARKK